MSESTAFRQVLVGSVAAIALLLVLESLSTFLPGLGRSATTFGYVEPVSSLNTAIAMCVGGYLGGKRFILVALLLVAVLWVSTIVLALQIAQPPGSNSLTAILAYSRGQILFSLLAAGAGAAIGAWLRMQRAVPPVR